VNAAVITRTGLGDRYALPLGATPDVAGNRIVIADGVSVANSDDVIPGSTTAYNAGDISMSAIGGLTLVNSQGNVSTPSELNSPVSSQIGGAAIFGKVQDVQNGSIDVSGNAITSDTTGNAASNAILAGDRCAN